VDATGWIAAAMGSNPSRAFRIRGDPRVSLKSGNAVYRLSRIQSASALHAV
jgi:hypothetical protein